MFYTLTALLKSAKPQFKRSMATCSWWLQWGQPALSLSPHINPCCALRRKQSRGQGPRPTLAHAGPALLHPGTPARRPLAPLPRALRASSQWAGELRPGIPISPSPRPASDAPTQPTCSDETLSDGLRHAACAHEAHAPQLRRRNGRRHLAAARPEPRPSARPLAVRTACPAPSLWLLIRGQRLAEQWVPPPRCSLVLVRSRNPVGGA